MSERNPQKIRKKLGKLKHLVHQHDGVSLSESESSCHLVISNIGVDNGIPRTDILALFQHSGNGASVQPILHLGADRSFGYASFSSIDAAFAARNAIQGKTLKHPVTGQYLLVAAAFVPSLPEAEVERARCQKLPEGLMLIEDYIDEHLERQLLQVVEDGDGWREVDSDDPTGQSLKHRRVRHFGYEFRYSTNDVDPSQPLLDDPIPSLCDHLLQRLVTDERISKLPDQLTVNRYLPGQGIPPHIDTHSAFHDGILSLSLGSGAVMDFKSLVNGKQVPVYLKPRSVLVMTGASRYAWTHSISPRKFDVIAEDRQSDKDEGSKGDESGSGPDVKYRGTRTSFTFRSILPERKCMCAFPDHCDTPREDALTTRDAQLTPWQLEATHVHRVYDEIASHFSSTRHTPWPKVKEFVASLEDGSAILDVGCGNGKYFGLKSPQTFFEVGCDRSLNLSSIAASRGFNALGADALSLPFRDATFDAVISIAVVHHLTTPERRSAALAEMLRVTRPGGQILVTVWAFEQRRKKEGKSKYLAPKEDDVEIKEIDVTKDAVQGDQEVVNTQGSNNNNSEESVNCLSVADLEIHENRTDFKQQDLLVPWHFKAVNQKKLQQQQLQDDPSENAERVFHRYYHVFKEGELENMVKSLDVYSVEILRSYYDQGNWGVIFRKL